MINTINDTSSLIRKSIHSITLIHNIEQEEFYTCAWDDGRATGSPVLAAAGKKGIIRLIRCVGAVLLLIPYISDY
jgi:hypothetical protein